MAIMGCDDPHSGQGQDKSADLMHAKPFAAACHGNADCEKDLHLNHQRRQARRDETVHRQEQQPELAKAHRHAIDRQIGPGDLGPGQEKHRRQQHECKAQRSEQQRRQCVEADADDDEIRPPDEHHRHRK